MKLFIALSVVFLAKCVFASTVTIPLRKIQRSGAYMKGSPAADRIRAALFRDRSCCGPTTVPATNLDYSQYTTRVGIGNPPTYYNLVVDTGSSNTFCGAGINYVRTPTSVPTGQNVSVSYGGGFFSGLEYLDQVTLAPNLVITNQSIGDALFDAGFADVDGIFGVGPVDLTRGSLSPDTSATIPTVMDNLLSQKLIENQVLGVYFSPATNLNDTNGALTYGGANPSLFEGKLRYVPVTKRNLVANYWGIDIRSVTSGNVSLTSKIISGVVDTGTSLILLANDVFDNYLAAIPGAQLDADTGLIDIPLSSVQKMQPLDFFMGKHHFIFDASAQLIPQDQNEIWGGVAGKQYGVITALGSFSGGGLDFILGQKFLERYYSVYDADTHRIAFAGTNYTHTF